MVNTSSADSNLIANGQQSNVVRWKGVLTEALSTVSRQAVSGFGISEDALEYVEELAGSLLLRLADVRPHSVHDVERSVRDTFPEPLNAWAVNEARLIVGRQQVARRNKEKPLFPVQKISSILKETLNYRIDSQVAVYMLAVLEYIAADILKLTANYVKNIRHQEITLQDLKVALRADTVLMDLFFRDDDDEASGGGTADFFSLSRMMVDQQQQQAQQMQNDHHHHHHHQESTGGVAKTYVQTAKDLAHDETQYLRDLNMLILVFRRAFEKSVAPEDGGGAESGDELRDEQQRRSGTRSKSRTPAVTVTETESVIDLDRIFSNISDIRDFTATFLALIEDTLEMASENSQPLIGTCYDEMAQAYEFNVYLTYVHDVLSSDCFDYLQKVLDIPKVRRALERVQWGFRLAAKYVLPKLLMIPIFHCTKYFQYLQSLTKLTESKDDMTDLNDADCLLSELKSRLYHSSSILTRKNFASQLQLRFIPCGHNQSAATKLHELDKLVDGFETKVEAKNAAEFILEGNLGKYHTLQPKLGNTLLGASDTLRSKSTRTTERYVFLFDSLLVLCKPAPQFRRTKDLIGGSSTGDTFKFKLKEFFQIRRVEILDREDTEDLKNAFEIKPRNNQPSVVVFAKTVEEKQNWMAALIMLQTRSMLERMLDSSLAEEDSRIPLVLPAVEYYRFAEKDSEDNIIFEDYVSSSGLPIVRGATLPKLIERLTPNQHADPNFTKMFLMTYRAFCEPRELLSLLVERFEIPDPNFFENHYANEPAWMSLVADGFTNGLADSNSPISDSDPIIREMLKKFRKKYAQPIQIRVLNVIRHWVDDHFYDFAQDEELLKSLKHFLQMDDTKYKHVKKWSKNILEIITRKTASLHDEPKEFHFTSEPPPIEWNLTTVPHEFDILTLHPVEIARQVTLLEFDLYRAVKPFELVDAQFTGKNKSVRSPQMTKLYSHTDRFAYWLEECILECENVEERAAVMNRIIEIMCVFEELNNFYAVIEVKGALLSAPVARLAHTWERLDKSLAKKFNEMKDLYYDPRHKQVWLKLKSINPPCIPFFGTQLTTLTHLNEKKAFLEHGAGGGLADVDRTVRSQSNMTTTAAASGEDGVPNLENPRLINVAKCRKIAETIGEIQLYQDQPYCFRVEPGIRHFFESLNPLKNFADNANEFQNYLWERSLMIEPKNCDRLPIFPMKRDPGFLKSPGIKHAKQPKPKSASSTPQPPFILTPLSRFGKDKPSSHNVAATAPASPTSTKDTPFSIIDIEPGKSPVFVSDVPNSSRESSFAASPSAVGGVPGKSTTMPRARTNSNPTSMTPAAAATAPPVPPRHGARRRGAPAPSPPRPPRSAEPSPPPAAAPTAVGLTETLRLPHIVAEQSTSAIRFQFPDISRPLPPRRPPSGSPPLSPELSLVRRDSGSAGFSASHQSHSPSTAPPLPPRPARVSTGSSVVDPSSTVSGSPPPPLFPRMRSGVQAEAPPRPPRKNSPTPQPAAPPLPPKTYRTRRD